MIKKLRTLMWDIIGLSVLTLLLTAFVEWLNHEASWDGLYAAHIKHIGLAISQVGQNPYCPNQFTTSTPTSVKASTPKHLNTSNSINTISY